VARVKLSYLSDDEKQFVHEQTVKVLEEVGVAYNTPQAIDLLEAAGAPVDREKLTARVPWSLVEECLGKVPRDLLLAARDPRNDVRIADGSLVTTSDGTATFFMDDRSGTRLEGSADLLAKVMRLFDALPEIDFVWPSLSARDLDPVTANLEIQAISLRNTTKHVQDEVRSPEYVGPLVDILEAVAGASLWERPIFSTINCTVAPLQHDRHMTEASIGLARAGVPILILPMALMGTTGPMSTLGTTIVNMAELLSAVVLFELAAPGCQVYSGIGSAAADMRTGFYLCGCPEAVLINLIGVEMSRFYGLRAHASVGTTDAKRVDFQGGVEAALTGVSCAAAGAEVLLCFGLLDGATTVSPAKTVLDSDTLGMIRRLVREEPIDVDTALTGDIAEVGIGGHYLGRKSTRQFTRAGELYVPETFWRDPFDTYAGRSLLDDAIERAEHLMTTHEVPPLADDVESHIAAVVAAHSTRYGG
jgi:trimethylamine---corrinoid protein Co-methyltransferase